MLNIKPQHRYSLKNIQLLGIASKNILKQEYECIYPFLEDFIKTVNELYNDGMTLNINGINKKYFGF
jgi:hypothetical protein